MTFRLDSTKQRTIAVPRAYWEEEPIAVQPCAPGPDVAPDGMEWFVRHSGGREECYLVPRLRRLRFPDGFVVNALELLAEYEGGEIVAIDRRASTVTVQSR